MIRDTDIRVFVDADNTLWDTDRVFAAAQLQLLEQVEALLGRHAETNDRLGFVRTLDQSIAERHHVGLRYPPQLLIKAIALALSGVEPARAARLARANSDHRDAIAEQDVDRVESTFLKEIRRIPELRSGVAEGLQRLHAAGHIIIVVTEAARGRSQRTARIHKLDQYIDRIIEAPKHARLYRRFQRFGGSSSSGYMVGDQLERDIRPAKEAGLTTIFFPGGFRPHWEKQDALSFADYVVTNFSEAADIIIERDRKFAPR